MDLCTDQLSGLVIDAGPAVTVQLRGELDRASEPDLRRFLDELEAEARPTSLTLDLAGLDFMDSAGVNLLVSENRHLSSAGIVFTLRKPNPHVRKVLDMSGAAKLLTVAD